MTDWRCEKSARAAPVQLCLAFPFAHSMGEIYIRAAPPSTLHHVKLLQLGTEAELEVLKGCSTDLIA